MNSQPVQVQSNKLVKRGSVVLVLALAVLALTGAISRGDDFNVIGADGHRIKLENNRDAKNPSWQELQDFLRLDRTDRIEYSEDSFACADYAERLHNNAEKAGWRSAFVLIDLGAEFRNDPAQVISVYRSPTPATGAVERSGGRYETRKLHALSVFETTDHGLVFIDSTGLRRGERGPASMDAMVDVEIGGEYIPEYVFPEPGWMPMSRSLGTLEKIEITW